jgi:hypothetical protein
VKGVGPHPVQALLRNAHFIDRLRPPVGKLLGFQTAPRSGESHQIIIEQARRFAARTIWREDEMPTLYTRRFNLKDSLSDEEVVSHWRWLLNEFAPLVGSVSGVRSVKLYSRHGALRADLSIAAELDDAGVYERLLVDAGVRKQLGRFYGAIDLKTSEQAFRREVTAELINALTSTA